MQNIDTKIKRCTTNKIELSHVCPIKKNTHQNIYDLLLLNVEEGFLNTQVSVKSKKKCQILSPVI